MSFLATVVAEIGKWLLTKLATFAQGLIEKAQRQKKAEDESKESVDPLKKAQSADEIQKATDDALNKF